MSQPHQITRKMPEIVAPRQLVLRTGQTEWLRGQYATAIAQAETAAKAQNEFSDSAGKNVEVAGFQAQLLAKMYAKHAGSAADTLNPVPDPDPEDDEDDDDDAPSGGEDDAEGDATG